MDILTEQEACDRRGNPVPRRVLQGATTGRRRMAAALNVPGQFPATAGEGGRLGHGRARRLPAPRRTTGSRCPTTSTNRLPGASAPFLPDPLHASVQVAKRAKVSHFIFLSVAQPAPVMRAYIEVRRECERVIREADLTATMVRPWYVVGPGHRWPLALVPLYRLAERFPSSREGARRLGLVTLEQLTSTLVQAVEICACRDQSARLYPRSIIAGFTSTVPV